MKVLVQHTKWGDQYWNATEPGQRLACMRTLFKTNDDIGFYAGLENDPLYISAKSGNVGDMGRLLSQRKNNEYEGWEIVEVSEA